MKKLKGANIDIDLTSQTEIDWAQDKFPRNEDEGSENHKCAIKNTSLCPYFRGIEHPDTVLCSYEEEKH